MLKKRVELQHKIEYIDEYRQVRRNTTSHQQKEIINLILQN